MAPGTGGWIFSLYHGLRLPLPSTGSQSKFWPYSFRRIQHFPLFSRALLSHMAIASLNEWTYVFNRSTDGYYNGPVPIVNALILEWPEFMLFRSGQTLLRCSFWNWSNVLLYDLHAYVPGADAEWLSAHWATVNWRKMPILSCFCSGQNSTYNNRMVI